MKIVCLGMGSEYVLGPIAKEAGRRGFDVIEVDMYHTDWRRRLATLQPGEFILITSHHLYVDSWYHHQTFGCPADIDGVNELIARYRPQRSYFVPHDLTSPLLPEELRAVTMFDGLLMPDERFWFLSAHVPVTVVGWVKAASEIELPLEGIAVLPSEVAYFLRNSPERFISVYGALFAMKPHVKFPQFPGVKRLEALARGCGAKVVPAGVDSTSVIAGAVCVVTNGVSSIVTEASLLKKPVLCIIDGIHPIEKQRNLIASLSRVDLALPDKSVEWVARQLSHAESKITHVENSYNLSLDYEKFFSALQIHGEMSS